MQNTAVGKTGNRNKYATGSAARLSDHELEKDGCGSQNEYEAADQHLLRRSFNRQGNQSTSSKVQQKLILQRRQQAVPQTATNLQGGPQLLHPSPNNSSRVPGNILIKNEQVNEQSSQVSVGHSRKGSRHSKQSMSRKPGKLQRKRQETKKRASAASGRQSMAEASELSRRDSLQLHIPPGASFMEVVENSRRGSNDVSQRQLTRSLESSSYQQSTSPQPRDQP